jgi:hypothetical protein
MTKKQLPGKQQFSMTNFSLGQVALSKGPLRDRDVENDLGYEHLGLGIGP